MTDIRHNINIKTTSPQRSCVSSPIDTNINDCGTTDIAQQQSPTQQTSLINTNSTTNLNLFQTMFHQTSNTKTNLYENYLKAAVIAQQQQHQNTATYKNSLLTPNTTPTSTYELAYRSLFQYNAACAAAAYNLYNNNNTNTNSQSLPAPQLPPPPISSSIVQQQQQQQQQQKVNETPSTSSASSIKSEKNKNIELKTTPPKRVKYSTSQNSYESVSPSVINDYDDDDGDENGLNDDVDDEFDGCKEESKHTSMTINDILGGMKEENDISSSLTSNDEINEDSSSSKITEIKTTLLKDTDKAINSCFDSNTNSSPILPPTTATTTTTLVIKQSQDDVKNVEASPFKDYLTQLKTEIMKSVANAIETTFENYLYETTNRQINPKVQQQQQQQKPMTNSYKRSLNSNGSCKRQRLNDYVRVSNVVTKQQQNENYDSTTAFKPLNHKTFLNRTNNRLLPSFNNTNPVLLQQQNRQLPPQQQHLTNQFYAAMTHHLQQRTSALQQPPQVPFTNPYLNAAANRLFTPYLDQNHNIPQPPLPQQQQQPHITQNDHALAALASVFQQQQQQQQQQRPTQITTPTKRRRTKVTDTRLSPRTSSLSKMHNSNNNINDPISSSIHGDDDQNNDDAYSSSNINDDDMMSDGEVDRQSITSVNDFGLLGQYNNNNNNNGAIRLTEGDSNSTEYIGYQTSTLSSLHLRKAKLMFFYTRYPSSTILRNYFPDVKFNKANTAQLVKWFSNFREFFYIQIERCARQYIAEGIQNYNELHVNYDSELFRVLNLHYNRNNQIEIPISFCYVIESTLKEFFKAIQESRDQDPSWKKAIYKIIARMDDLLPEYFKSVKWMESLESHI